LAQARGVIDEVLTNEETAMYPFKALVGMFRVVVLTVPIKLSEPRFEICRAENALYVSTHYPNTLCLTVRGNGAAYPHHLSSSRFLKQASCITPVAHPSLLHQSPDAREVNITQLHPLPAPEPLESNNHLPALPKHSTKTAKTAVPRQKK